MKKLCIDRMASEPRQVLEQFCVGYSMMPCSSPIWERYKRGLRQPGSVPALDILVDKMTQFGFLMDAFVDGFMNLLMGMQTCCPILVTPFVYFLDNIWI